MAGRFGSWMKVVGGGELGWQLLADRRGGIRGSEIVWHLRSPTTVSSKV